MICKECEVKPCACNMKLREYPIFSRKIKPFCKKIDSVVIHDIEDWSRVNIWRTWDELYIIEDSEGDDGIVLDLKQMQNLARIFDSIIKRRIC